MHGSRCRAMAMAVAAAGSLVLGAAAASAQDGQLPFRASFSGQAEFTGDTTVAFQGRGTATHMDAITTNGAADITGDDDSTCGGGIANTHRETLTAANGDTLTVISNDVACPTGPYRYHGTGHWAVTSGTGRFAGTTGAGTLDGDSDFNAGTFHLDLSGSISLR